MSKVKLIKQLKNKNPKLNNLQINFLVDFFSESIADALTKGKNVEIRGLGRWYCKKLKEFVQFDRGVYIEGCPVGCDFDIGDDYSMGKFSKLYGDHV